MCAGYFGHLPHCFHREDNFSYSFGPIPILTFHDSKFSVTINHNPLYMVWLEITISHLYSVKNMVFHICNRLQKLLFIKIKSSKENFYEICTQFLVFSNVLSSVTQVITETINNRVIFRTAVLKIWSRRSSINSL